MHLASKVVASEFSLVYNFEGQGNDGNQYQDTNTGFTIFGGNNQGGETTTSNVTIKMVIALLYMEATMQVVQTLQVMLQLMVEKQMKYMVETT